MRGDGRGVDGHKLGVISQPCAMRHAASQAAVGGNADSEVSDVPRLSSTVCCDMATSFSWTFLAAKARGTSTRRHGHMSMAPKHLATSTFRDPGLLE